MRFLLDTNLISELRNKPRANPSVQRWAAELNQDDTAISVITLMELQSGPHRVSRHDPVFAAELMRWIAEIVRPQYAGRILAVDEEVALQCAALMHPRTMPFKDALIGATALVQGMTIATRNVRDFSPMGVSLLNPWAD